MQYVADFHLHSKYSRAVSPSMTLPVMVEYARQKGLDILTASDWTHTLWFKEIRNQLEEARGGLYRLKSQINSNNQKEPLFLLSTEIASIYSEKGKLRRIHNLVFAPNFETAEKINQELLKRGCNLHSDGRPIVGISSKNLLELILSIDEQAMIIPCHVWTPHFGLYGSASGYDSIEESFEDLSKYIYGIETGLSSDPEMNWEIPELMNRSILSFSDAHSPAKMGREATVFELEEPTYENIKKAIMRNSQANKIKYTIEFYPEEGKYHFSGHRNCKIVFGPEEIRKQGSECPVCHKRLTEGVLYRLQQLADEKLQKRATDKISPHGIKWYTDSLKKQPPYVKLVPLLEIVAEGLDSSVSSQKSKDMFAKVCEELGSELHVLLQCSIADIAQLTGEKIAEGIEKVRGGNIVIDPGFDGEYGHVKIFNEEKKDVAAAGEKKDQMGFF